MIWAGLQATIQPCLFPFVLECNNVKTSQGINVQQPVAERCLVSCAAAAGVLKS